MKTKFKAVALMGRQHTEGVVESLIAVIDYLQKHHIKTIVESETAQMLPNLMLPSVKREDLKANCELIIVVGGDGSLLAAARAAAWQNLPVVGINRGRLGFLTDIAPTEIEKIGKILQGDYIEESRFLLTATVVADGETATEQTALNDVVLLPSEINRMISFSVYINDKFVCHHRADGMIVATPTGSTAHALSGGGPILRPGLDAIVLLPMFPHTLSSRPIVIKGDSNIELVMGDDCKAAPNISCDGQKLVPVSSCGKIRIRKYCNNLRLLHLTDYDYYATLRGKLNWEHKC